MKTKQGLLKAVNQEIQQLRVLAASIEASDEPDLHPITELASVLEKRRQNLGLKPHEVAELCGLSANTYRAMELDKGNPTINTLKSVGQVLNYKIWIELI
jgi:DNA-binding XRE family transcriptional regulator